MPTHNADIAAVFSDMADLLELRGDNPFRIRAYRNAARTVGDLGKELRESVEAGEDLTAIQGIGADLAKKIAELVTTGECAAYKELKAEFPPGITDLLRVQGLGPKKVKALWKELGVETIEALEKAAQGGRIRGLAGFGEKTEQNILKAVQARAADNRRYHRASVATYAASLVEYIEKERGVRRVTLCGSYRRGRETVGDLDVLVLADDPAKVMDRFVAYDEVRQVLAKGETKSSVLLKSGIQVDLRTVPEESYGAAMQYFTGSLSHNIALRAIAQKKGLKLNEYGLMRGDEAVAGRDEEGIYRVLGLHWVPPELREDRGEVDLAAKGPLPALVELRDLKGDLHNHSTWSDGANSIEEMAHAAKERGFEYMAITDHSKRLTVANGLDEARVRKQIAEVDDLNARLKGFTVLKGIEVDILEDGSLDLPDDVLRELDIVVASVHSRFNLAEEKQTERILRALDNPYVTILGHPTGRLLLERPPYEVDVARVIRHAAQRGCFLELNANPMRLDLHDAHCRLAKEAGVLVSIDCDGHQVSDFGNLVHGIVQARRGWLTKEDVLNTRTLKQLRALIARARRG